MIVREITDKDRQAFDRVATHPLQSYAWGEFRQKTGVVVERWGLFEASNLVAGYQVTIHPLPGTRYTLGYFPRGPMPDREQIEVLRQIGRKHNCLAIKLEPNVWIEMGKELPAEYKNAKELLAKAGCALGRPLFTLFSFQVDLTRSDEEMLAAMKPKTRYNIRVAQRSAVKVATDNSLDNFEAYLKLMQETTARQKFYAHSVSYHRQMWKYMHKAEIAKLLTATWQDKLLAAWVVFVFNGTIYYPYGASSSQNREMMASNLLMWEAMKFGQKMGCTNFDLWGALGPNPDPKDPWYGFHRFKEGYGARLVEFLGSFDLVLNPTWYKIYRVADAARWKYLRGKAWMNNLLGRQVVE